MNRHSKGHLRASLASIRNAKMRSFWTMLGVIIGVTSVITIVAIGQGVKQQVSGQVQSYGKDLVTVRPAQLRTTSDTGNFSLNELSGLNVSAQLTSKDVAAIQHTKGVAASAPLTVASGRVTAPNGNYDGLVLGTTGDLPGLINQQIAYGATFDNDVAGARDAILSQGAVDEMFDENVPLGRSFTFHGERFIVKGIFKSFGSNPLSQQADLNRAIFIPNDVAEELTRESAPTYAILVKPDPAQPKSELMRRIGQTVANLHGGTLTVEVRTGDEDLSGSRTILDLLTKLVAGVAAVSLLVGGIGIMNVMLVSVAERTREIGIRKAIGATNRQILTQFMFESSVLTLVGGLIGIGLSYLIALGLRLATSLTPVISWQVVVIAGIVSLLVGVIFGSVPALRAARKDPIEALRSE